MSLLEKIINEVSEVDEVGALVALFRISQLPTLVVEDASDVHIYSRWVEQHLFGTYKVDVLAAGGRENLLNLYERRNEFADLPVVFIVNRGMWLFSGIPKFYDHADIIFTQGYSIENDIYSRGGVEYLLDSAISKEYWVVRESIIRWFAIEVEEFSAGVLSEFNINLDELVPKDQNELKITCLRTSPFHYPRARTIENIRRWYRFKLPGILLFQMLARFSDTSLEGLYNTALVNYESTAGPQSLISKIKERLDQQRSVPYHEIPPEHNTKNQIPIGQWTRQPIRNSNEKTNINALYSNADELISDLILMEYRPTVIVEQETDNNLDWWIEQLMIRLKTRKVNHQKDEVPDILSIEGKDQFLSVYARRGEFSDEVPVAFVANREMWSFGRIRVEYDDIILTQGYSIENDLYVEANLESLLQPHETWKHRQVLNSTIEWFAFEVEKFLAAGNPKIDVEFLESILEGQLESNYDFEELLIGRYPKMDVELSELVLEGQLELNKEFCKRRGFRQPSLKRIQYIKEGYQKRLPGKFLFQILARFLNTRGREFNFDTTPRDLHNIAFAVHSSKPPLYRLIQKIEQKLDDEIKRLGLEESTTSQHEKIDSQMTHHVQSKHHLKKQRKPQLKQNQSSNLRQTQPPKPLKPKVKVGDMINVKILKNDGIKVTVQLMTDNQEEITFEAPYYPKQVGEETILRVVSFDNTRKVNKVTPKLGQTQLPQNLKPIIRPKVQVGDKIYAKIVKKDGNKVTVQLITDNQEEITFEAPYYPGKIGEEPKLRVTSVDSTGKVTKVVP